MIKEDIIKNIYDLFRFNNLRVVLCPNEALGLDGPFKEVNEIEIVDILNGDFKIQDLQEGITFESFDIMISGE